MIRIKNRAMARTPGAEKWRSGFRNSVLFSVLAACTAVLAGITGLGYVTVLAADEVEQNQEMAGDDSLRLTGVDTSGDVDDVNIPDSQTDDTGQVYDFKDNKTTGTVTVTKVWDDELTNDEREIPDIKISTKKPSKSTLGYTITFHSNGTVFSDNTTENDILYNANGQIISGIYKTGVGIKEWCYDKECTQEASINEDGSINIQLSGDIDLYAKLPTFDIITHDAKGLETGVTFANLIPNETTKIMFCNELMPKSATLIDVDDDGDGGVVAWMEDTVMKVSTQIQNQNVIVKGNAEYLFDSKKSLDTIDFSNLNTSELTSMTGWFMNDSALNNVDMNDLDLRNVKKMVDLFYYGGGSELDFKLTNKELTNLEDANYMFGKTNARSIDISGLNCPSLTNIHSMFYETHNLKTIIMDDFKAPVCKTAYNLAGWTYALETVSMKNVDLSKVEDMKMAFYYSTLSQIDADGLDISSITNASNMFGNTHLTSFDFFKGIKFGLKSDSINAENLFYENSYIENITLKNIDFSHITSANWIFSNCANLKTVDLSGTRFSSTTSINGLFSSCTELYSINMSNVDISCLENGDSMFNGLSKLELLNLSDSNFENLKTAANMFGYNPCLREINLKNIKMTNAIVFYGLFSGCSSLKNIDLSDLSFPNAQTISQMFSGCLALESVNLSNVDFSTLQSMEYLFSGNSNILTIDMNHMKAPKLITINKIFSGCSALKSVNLSNVDFGTLKSMEALFSDNMNIETVDMHNLNATQLATVNKMFAKCVQLKSVNLSECNFQNLMVTDEMFANCELLSEIKTRNIDIPKIKTMKAMFKNCRSLDALNFTDFNTSGVVCVDSLFFGCKKLSLLDLSNFDTSSVTSMTSLFNKCENLSTIKLGDKFSFVGTDYALSGTWQNTAGETFTSGTFPSNVADTYTKISN